jgi:hypothetical protein
VAAIVISTVMIGERVVFTWPLSLIYIRLERSHFRVSSFRLSDREPLLTNNSESAYDTNWTAPPHSLGV